MDKDLSARQLPFSLEAEQSVLGAILIDPDCITRVTQVLRTDDFYLESHRSMYDAMKEMFTHDNSIDAVTLIDALVKSGTYSQSGGTDYIKLIVQTVPTSSNVMDYARIVGDKAKLRELIAVCEESAEMAYSAAEDAGTIIDAAEQRIFSLAQGHESRDFVHIKELVKNVYGNLQLLANNAEEVTGTKTGFEAIDRILVGMGKGDLILVAARPGMGKTALAVNIATSVAKRSKKAVAIFSLEMSGEQLATRMMSSEALIDSYTMRAGNIQPNDSETWAKLAHAGSRLSSCEIYVDDTSGMSVTTMKAKLRRLKNLGLVVIDYLQLMQSDRRNDNRVQEVAEISRSLKLLAKDLEVPLIVCAQLNRGPEQRTEKRPQLSDLRDSGAIEQDADVVMFIYREDYYKDSTEPNTADIIVAKNRHGSVSSIKVGWLAKYTLFTTLEEDRKPPN